MNPLILFSVAFLILSTLCFWQRSRAWKKKARRVIRFTGTNGTIEANTWCEPASLVFYENGKEPTVYKAVSSVEV